MGITERRLREKEQVRAAILTTAWQMVKEDGWQSLSIRKIADAIEYSVPVIYDHFENKEAILIAFGQQGFALLSQKIRQAKEAHKDPVKQLKAMANAYWDFAQKNKEYYRLMYGVGMACCGKAGKCVTDKTRFDYLIMESITAVMSKSTHTDTNPCLKYHTFWSILHGLVSIKITGNSSVDSELDKVVLDDAIEGFIKNLS